MKKTLLAAALMVGFAGVAQAETSVTLYGVVDGGVGYERLKGKSAAGDYYARSDRKASYRKTRTGLLGGVQRGNRWGLRGSEDLGDGLRMIFQLESGFDIADGNFAQGDNKLFGRAAYFGLAGDSWGQLTFGRQDTISTMYIPGIGSPFGGGFGQANFGATFSSVNTVRYDNMIQYQTPSFAGFQAGLGYSFNTAGKQSGTVKTNGKKVKSDNNAWTAAVRYANGPIAVGASYDQVRYRGSSGVRFDELLKDYGEVGKQLGYLLEGEGIIGLGDIVDGTSSKKTTVRAWNLVGSYDFEVAKIYLGFGQERNGRFAGQFKHADLGSGVQDGMRVNNYTLGLSAPVGAGNIMASWAMGDLRKAPKGDMRNKKEYRFKKQQVYSLGYTYPLSKRTNVYAVGSYAKNVDYAPDLKSTLLGVGISHQF